MHADHIYSCLYVDLFMTQWLGGFQSHLIDGPSRIFSVTPCDARRLEVLRRHSICYNDLLMRADHPTISGH